MARSNNPTLAPQLALYKASFDDGAAPSHPGEILREDFLPHYALSPEMLAQRIGVARNVVAALLAEERGVTSDMAHKLGAVFANGAHYWSALQRQYDFFAGAEPFAGSGVGASPAARTLAR